VHALERIHGAIRPGGVLLDIHPLPEHARIEVVAGGLVVDAGRLDASRFIAKVLPAQAALADQAAAGSFVTEQVEAFDYLTWFDGIEEWLSYMAAEWVSADVPPTLAERVRALLPGGMGPIRTRESVHAARLRRAEPARAQDG
jgi:hypothetical protein